MKLKSPLANDIEVRMEMPPAPFLKWAGGKSQLLDELVRLVPPRFGTYYEPFLGAGALFFRLFSEGRIGRAVLSDLNKDLISCYVTIRDALDEVLLRLESLQLRACDRDFFYAQARPRFNSIRLETGLEVHPEKAALMIYLNKTCYNGLYRVNSSGEFNVPWGRYRSPRVYDEENLRAVSRALNSPGIEVKCCDYRQALDQASRGDFVYLDPPYHPISRTSSFTQYIQKPFGEKDQRELAGEFASLTSRGCLVLMSNSGAPFVRSLYEGLAAGVRLKEVSASRSISCKGDRRNGVTELIISNFSPLGPA